jgi:hypothetical protein
MKPDSEDMSPRGLGQFRAFTSESNVSLATIPGFAVGRRPASSLVDHMEHKDFPQ